MALADYLEDYLGGLASQLGWNSGSYGFIVSEALRLYGVSTEAEAVDLNKLYALAKVALWEAVLRDISMDFDYSSNGASFKRSQAVEQVKNNLEDARVAAQVYLPDFSIDTGSLGGDQVDPYSSYPYWLR